MRTASEALVTGLLTGCKLGTGLPPLKTDVAGLEAADVDGLAGGDDDFLRNVRTDLGGVGDHRGGGHSQAHEVREAGLSQLLGGRGAHAGELFDGLDGLDCYCHLITLPLIPGPTLGGNPGGGVELSSFISIGWGK